jgi:hypothetical protein
MKLRMSFFVTRPLVPVPSSCVMSMLCSRAMLRTSGLDFVRRKSSADCAPPFVPVPASTACASPFPPPAPVAGAPDCCCCPSAFAPGRWSS